MFRENPRGVTFISSTSQGEAPPHLGERRMCERPCIRGNSWEMSSPNPNHPMESRLPPVVQFLGSTFRNLDSGGWWVFTNFCTPPCCSHQLYTIVTSSIPLNHPGSSVVRSRGISPNRIRWEARELGRIFWQISSSKSSVFLANFSDRFSERFSEISGEMMKVPTNKQTTYLPSRKGRRH